jgi:N6-L-threonylcarbamoyladenine synthase
MLPDTPFDFSFSGLKTAVMQAVRKMEAQNCILPVDDICASFQEAVADVIVAKAIKAAEHHRVKNIVLCGGVAANDRLRTKLENAASDKDIDVFLPSPEMCTDNAAMIAIAGWHRLRAGIFAAPETDVYSRTSL